MYIIELILKILTKKKDKDDLPVQLSSTENIEYETCEHLFMPIDSSGEILSCSKCGKLVRRSDLKNPNFFLRSEKEIDEEL